MKSGRIVGSYSTGRSKPVLLDRRTLGDCSRRGRGNGSSKQAKTRSDVAATTRPGKRVVTKAGDFVSSREVDRREIIFGRELMHTSTARSRTTSVIKYPRAVVDASGARLYTCAPNLHIMPDVTSFSFLRLRATFFFLPRFSR